PYNTQTICRTDWVMVKSTENRKFELNRSQQLSHTRFGVAPNRDTPTELLDDHRALEPPDPIPNSAVKRRFADGSVGFPHVRVGHRQAPKTRTAIRERGLGFCLFGPEKSSYDHARPVAGVGKRNAPSSDKDVHTTMGWLPQHR